VDQVGSAVAWGRLDGPVVVVLEGRAREGVESGVADGVAVLHAEGSGDDKLVDVIVDAADSDGVVTLVSADRGLRRRAEALGTEVVGPRWLLERLAP
jgi:rRNA-processing protein FCF1